MFKRQTIKQAKGGENMTEARTNYAMVYRSSEPIQLHHYGFYMSYSSPDGDFLCTAFPLKPYVEVEGYLEQVGVKQEVVRIPQTKKVNVQLATGGQVTQTVLTGGPETQTIEEVPVYKQRRRTTTPKFTAYGKPIKTGDKVTFKDVAGTLEEVSDAYFIITNDAGRHYFPWTATNVADRVERSKQ